MPSIQAVPEKPDLIDFDAVIRNFDGTEIKEAKSDGEIVPLTLRSVCCNALSNVYRDEESLSGTEKNERGRLAMKIYEGSLLNPTVEQKTLLKTLVAKAYGPVIIARAWALLDPAENKITSH